MADEFENVHLLGLAIAAVFLASLLCNAVFY